MKLHVCDGFFVDIHAIIAVLIVFGNIKYSCSKDHSRSSTLCCELMSYIPLIGLSSFNYMWILYFYIFIEKAISLLLHVGVTLYQSIQ
uniref:Uncharacterized protein n=1 Tax=Manihot esculenta TaxID=3983 RepID=A0A2C9WCF2_MANES